MSEIVTRHSYGNRIVNSSGTPIITSAEKQREQTEELKKLNNEEFIAFLMMYSPYGALCQVFIIEAIRKYSEMVAQQENAKDDPDAIVNPVVWQGIAKDIYKKHTMKYGRND